MQSGKTTHAIKLFNSYLKKEDCLPIFATHPSNNVLIDLKTKMKDIGIFDNNTILNPRDDRSEYKKFISRLMKYNTIDDKFGIIGLKNESFFKHLDSALLHYHEEKVLFNDEYDTDQIRFINNRQPVKRDNQIRSYDIEGVIHVMELLSATNLAALISDTDFDKVNRIKPEEGYNCKRNYEIVSDRTMQAIRLGNRRDDIDEIIESTQHNVMINISTLQDDHSTIADGLYHWNCMVVNSDEDESYDLRQLDEGKTIIIGGNMFNRGQTFNRIQTLIFDRPSHQAAMLQAIGRLFGYRDYETKIVCTSNMQDQIEEAFSLESKITDDLLRLPHKERRAWLLQQKAPKNLNVFSAKNNGWRTTNIADYAVIEPEFECEYDEKYFSDPKITMLQRRVEGAPPARGQYGFWGTCVWGNRSVEKYVEDFCNQHPQGRILSEPNENGELRRKIIVPPMWEAWDDTQGEWVQIIRHSKDNPNGFKREDLEEHFWVDNNYNSELRTTCMTKWVGSILANGRIGWWYNLNVLSEDRETTGFSRNS